MVKCSVLGNLCKKNKTTSIRWKVSVILSVLPSFHHISARKTASVSGSWFAVIMWRNSEQKNTILLLLLLSLETCIEKNHCETLVNFPSENIIPPRVKGWIIVAAIVQSLCEKFSWFGVESSLVALQPGDIVTLLIYTAFPLIVLFSFCTSMKPLPDNLSNRDVLKPSTVAATTLTTPCWFCLSFLHVCWIRNAVYWQVISCHASRGRMNVLGHVQLAVRCSFYCVLFKWISVWQLLVIVSDSDRKFVWTLKLEIQTDFYYFFVVRYGINALCVYQNMWLLMGCNNTQKSRLLPLFWVLLLILLFLLLSSASYFSSSSAPSSSSGFTLAH